MLMDDKMDSFQGRYSESSCRCNQFEMVALNLSLQFAYLGKYQVCELGKGNMCNQFVPKISDFGTGCT